MKDVIIKIYKDSSVYTESGIIGINYENLQGKLVFEFVDEFIDGTAYLEFERKFEKGLIPMNKVGKTYEIEIKSSLLKEIGNIELQLRITQDGIPSGIPVYKSKVFTLEVLDAINATSEIPDEYPEWIDIANEKIKEMDNLNITTERVEDGVDIVLTDKKGNTTKTEVKDGAPGPQGPQGEPGAVKMQVVDTLPETGETDTIYLVKKDNPGEQNLYDEYVYTDTGWEHIGDTSVDLSDYYTKEEVSKELNKKQDILTAGDNITISDDGVISAKGGESIYEVRPTALSMINYMDKTLVAEQITKMFTDGTEDPILRVRPTSTNNVDINYYDFKLGRTDYPFSQKSSYYFMINPFIDITGAPIQAWNTYLNIAYIYISGSWNSDNKFTCTGITCNRLFSKKLEDITTNDKVLIKTNTTVYTPTKDYHPATKKYVDDNIKTYTAGDNITISDDGVISAAGGLPSTFAIYNSDSAQIISGANVIDSLFYKEDFRKALLDTTMNGTVSGMMIINHQRGYTMLEIMLGGVSEDISIFDVRGTNYYIQGSAEYSYMASFDISLQVNLTTGDYYGATTTFDKYTNMSNVLSSPTEYAGYDASKNQTLKNLSGTLTWVDE
nr:MAG TPA: PROTEIN (MANNOSE-BINDING PROTEIN A), HOST DEFENSE, METALLOPROTEIN, SUGAR.9A [Caudoviricetes sp.]